MKAPHSDIECWKRIGRIVLICIGGLTLIPFAPFFSSVLDIWERLGSIAEEDCNYIDTKIKEYERYRGKKY